MNVSKFYYAPFEWPLKVSSRDFSWGKGGRCVWPTTYHPCSAETSR